MADRKEKFEKALGDFVTQLGSYSSTPDGQWTVKGFIDTFKNVYTIRAAILRLLLREAGHARSRASRLRRNAQRNGHET